jgi:glycosyltransferase involved in cell wall biosynthesis
MSEPFFSIIVAAFNAQDTIRKTIDSVISQNFDDYEIIVKDGGSKDGTLANIPESEKIKVYSNPDGGIYQGMNEGIGYSSGRYLCFLNCGDFFENENVLSSFYELAKDLPDSKNILYGNYSRNGVHFKQPSQITPFYLYRTPLCHQTMFFGKDIFSEFGGYDTSYRILADYNHTLHAFSKGLPFLYADVVVCDYLGGGASETKKGNAIKKAEYDIIQRKYFTKSQLSKYKFKVFISFRGLRQALISDKSPAWVRKLYRALVNKVNG